MFSHEKGSFQVEPTLNSLNSSLYYDADDEMLREENLLDLSGLSSSLKDEEPLYEEEPQLDILQMFDQYNNDPYIKFWRSGAFKAGMDSQIDQSLQYYLQYIVPVDNNLLQAKDSDDHFEKEEYGDADAEESDTETDEFDTSSDEESDESEDDSDDDEDSIVDLTDMEYGEESDFEMITEDEDFDSDQDEMSDKDSGFEEASEMDTSDDDASDSD
ncbi:unnamed protein product [Caenorhabditis nigoni]